MKNKTLIKALNAISFSFPLEEIQCLMDEELKKDPSEMDGELVDLCMDILEKGYAEQKQDQTIKNSKGTKGIKLKKAVLVAAIVMIIIAIAIPVSAAFIQNGVSDKIVRFCSDYFHIDLRQGSTNANHYSDKNIDLIQVLQKRGFNNVILPSDLLNYNYSEDIVIQKGDYLTSATIMIEDSESEIHGAIGITQYNEIISPVAGTGLVASMYTHVVQLSINGIDILVFGNDKNSYIKYLDNNTEYSITLEDCDFDIAVKIANSIK